MKSFPNIEELINNVVDYLQKVGYSPTRIAQHKSACQHLIQYMNKKQISSFNAEISNDFIYQLLDGRQYDQISRWEKDIIMCVNRLTDYLEAGIIKYRRLKVFYVLDGAVGTSMQEYILTRRKAGISSQTINEAERLLYDFLDYLKVKGINELFEITSYTIIDYTVFYGVYKTLYIRHRMLSVLRGYLRYLYDCGKHVEDLSKALPKDKQVKQAKLPSTYNQTEVEALLKAIDRGSPKGKRDYAMVLITARLGLRASDVCNLTFNSLIWDKNLIVLSMDKTKKRIELPLLTEIGEGIIDYLKYGRPESELPYVFLHVNTPYDRLNRSTLHSIISQYIRKAGIETGEKRKHGPHALRHSLACVLLEKKTPLPVISEILGHSNTESTRYYLRIDIDSLRQCQLEVPPVPNIFYEGGAKR